MHVSVGSSGYIRLYYACLPCLALTTWTQPRQTRTSRSCAVVPPLRHEKSNDRMPPAPCTETSCTPGQTCLCATCLCARCGSIIERLYPLKYTESSPAPRRVEARPAAPSSPLLNSCSWFVCHFATRKLSDQMALATAKTWPLPPTHLELVPLWSICEYN